MKIALNPRQRRFDQKTARAFYMMPKHLRTRLVKGPKYRRGDSIKPLRAKTYYEGETRPGTEGVEYQASPGLTLHFIGKAKSYGLQKAEVRTLLFDPHHVLGLWLRRQDDPDGVFNAMWLEARTETIVSWEEATANVLKALKSQAETATEPRNVNGVWLNPDEATENALFKASGMTNHGTFGYLMADLIEQGVVYKDLRWHKGGKVSAIGLVVALVHVTAEFVKGLVRAIKSARYARASAAADKRRIDRLFRLQPDKPKPVHVPSDREGCAQLLAMIAAA